MLLASSKFYKKSQDVSDQGLDANPCLIEVEKRIGGEKPGNVSLHDSSDGKGGIMLYTSGTTSRPVSNRHPFTFSSSCVTRKVYCCHNLS